MKYYTLALLLGLAVLISSRSSAQAPIATLKLKIIDEESATVLPLGLNNRPLRTNDLVTQQPPNIAYPTPQVYALNQPIPVLQPFNTGGAVPPAIYGQVSTVISNSSLSGYPSGIVTDQAGNCYFTSYMGGSIVKVSPSGNAAAIANIAAAAGMTIDQQGNLYITGFDENVIYKITPGGVKTVLAGSVNNYGTTDGTGSSARFALPGGICIDSQGNLYVLDKDTGKIRKITPTGVVTTLTVGGNTIFPGADGLSIDSQGNIYIADSPHNQIKKVSSAGAVSVFAGSGASQSIDGTGTSAGFYYPTGITIDSQGNLYVSDYRGFKIRKITPSGVVTTIAGSGISGTSNGIGSAASFAGPINTSFDASGNTIYIADFTGNSVKKLSLSGYSIDRPLPQGLTFDATTGIISGTPTALASPANYTITAYNGYGSSKVVINIAVSTTSNTNSLLPSVITLPVQQPDMLGPDNYYDPHATSTNNETPITFTSSDPSIIYITPDGRMKALKPGTVTLTASQAGNAHYSAATPVTQQVNIIEYLVVSLPPISSKSLCTADFNANAIAADNNFPMSYASSNHAVATIDNDGLIHITGMGSTIITLSQQGSPPLYVSAQSQSQTFTVTAPVKPSISIASSYSSSCLGSPVTFTATPLNGGSAPIYQWKVNNVNTGTNSAVFTSTSLANGDEVTCTITNTDNSCISNYTGTSNLITLSLVAPSNPTISITASTNEVFYGTPITFTASVKNADGTVSYQWMVNDMPVGINNPVFNSNALNNNDVVTCTISSTAPCSTPVISNPVKVILVTRVNIPNTFTPNGDGVNDKWNISGIGSYPNCRVNVYNRFGKMIYQSRGYQQAWDGTISGSAAPVSTYYYVIELGIKNIILSGYVTIIR